MNTAKETGYDVIVVGSGAAGMTAAAVAASKGLSVLVVEKTDLIGGNTSFSGGMVYIPNNSKMDALGEADDPVEALAYLDATVPVEAGREQRETYIQHGREAIDYLERHTSVKLKPVPFYPDYYPDLRGARKGARVLEPVAFDASTLGSWFKKLRPPIPEFTILGGMMVAREDLPHFRAIWRSPRSFLRVALLVARHGLQRLRHHRGSRLVLGNALAGRLLKSLLDLEVDILTEQNISRVCKEDGRVIGIAVVSGGKESIIHSRQAVVLATGGFSHSQQKRQAYLPGAVSPESPYAPASTGDGLDLGTAAGGVIGSDNTNNAYWSPASVYDRADGRKVVYPHTVTDRGKPGSIVVNGAGLRFTNEAVSYHRFGEALIDTGGGEANLPAYILCDSAFIWKYGLGAIIPFRKNLGPYQKNGYLHSAPTISALAAKLGADEDALNDTIKRFNVDAENGKDTEFGRGEDIYSRYLGDNDVGPNPCLAPIVKPPFHAIELVLSDLGTVAGLKANADCQVLDSGGSPIPGLYAVGNDMQSIMRGRYPGPGITLGPALTFGYLAAEHIYQSGSKDS